MDVRVRLTSSVLMGLLVLTPLGRRQASLSRLLVPDVMGIEAERPPIVADIRLLPTTPLLASSYLLP